METLRHKEVKTRKEHSCWGCRELIPKGTLVTNIVNTDGGDIMTTYWCAPCQEWVDESDDDGDGFLEGEVGDERKEQQTDDCQNKSRRHSY